MMFVKILGIFDLICAGILLASLVIQTHYLIIVVVTLYLILKGLFFIFQSFYLLSLFDVLVGITFLLNLIFPIPLFLLAILSVGLIIKAFFSFA